MHSTDQTGNINAVLVGIQTPGMTNEDMQSSLDELARLVTTLGYQVIGRMSQKRKSERGFTVLGDGKLHELAEWTGGTGEIAPGIVKKKHKAALKFGGAEDESDDDDSSDDSQDDSSQDFEDFDDELDASEPLDDESSDSPTKTSKKRDPKDRAAYVVFDCDLSPSQLRNIESASGASALDRTGVIIEIFSRHAKTRAAKLQVEIARLAYVAPRLRETGGDEDRGGGGVGGKGAGETSLELDRRNIRDRIKELKDELGSIAAEHDVRRARRNQELTVALVGYTNAGKSSLMRALTGSDVLVADKLFATLDTTVRLLYPESRPRILISDTVGFIKKLPHDLVASFKSTLDEALNASLLLYVVDCSDPTFRSQLEVTQSVLREVGVDDVASRLVLNKVDRLEPIDLAMLKREYPDAIFLSAISKDDVSALRDQLITHFESGMVDEEFHIPYAAKGIVGEVRDRARVLEEAYDERGMTLKVRGQSEQIDRLRSLVKKITEPHR
ncbi:GTPase HflX [soil metagenome]